MIKRLQRKFVLIAAICLLIVELTIVGGINAVNIYQTNRNADNILELIIENDGKFPEINRPDKIPEKPDDDSNDFERQKSDKHKDFNEETKY